MEQVTVKDCSHGKGVFANRDFLVGEVVLRFSGPKITGTEAGNPDIERFVVQTGPEEYINTEPPGKFTNHSCDPNAGLRDPLTLVAIRNIKKGEEIYFDYSTCMLENDWTLDCHCGTSKCRRLVEDFPKLSIELQRYYSKLGVAPGWLFNRK